MPAARVMYFAHKKNQQRFQGRGATMLKTWRVRFAAVIRLALAAAPPRRSPTIRGAPITLIVPFAAGGDRRGGPHRR